ncbi:uncharacterized protein LOC102802903 [Saccoglossus kowalevskii]
MNSQVILKTRLGFLAKNQTPGRDPEPIVIPRLTNFVGKKDRQELILCPVRALSWYCDSTKVSRGSEKRMFVCYGRGKQSHPASNITISRIVDMVVEAYNLTASSSARLERHQGVCGYKTSGGGSQIPVRVVVNGTAQNSTLDPNTHEIIPIPNAYHSFYHVYDFFSFRDEFDEAEFIAHKAPMGYVCPGRKSDVEIPEFPPQFAVHIETAKKQLKKTHYSWEYYDQPGKMVQMRALPNDDMQVGNYIWNPYNWDPVDLLHDYNTGIEYTIDTENGNCTIKPIWKY